jgi:hypothetical protein
LVVHCQEKRRGKPVWRRQPIIKEKTEEWKMEANECRTVWKR